VTIAITYELRAGTSIAEGKYATVRGLSDRYTGTTLNGVRVPSADPRRRAVQMDLFPTGTVDSITVTKTFMPNLSGDFTGGGVDIKTKGIPEGPVLGVTLSTPDADRYGFDREYLRGRIIGALGGMAAEEEVFNVVTTGSESDLETVSRIARSMVGRWGMSEKVGRLSVLPAEGDPRMAGISDALLDAVDEEVRRITDECYAEARRLLRDNRGKLDAIVVQLLARESLDESEVYAAAGIARPAGQPPTKAANLSR